MKVDIWSDIRCPFCYIGKHKFEEALEQFDHKKDVEVIWHSFQLDPNLQTQPEIDTVEYFTKVKGVSREQAVQMLGRAKEMGAEIGLKLDLESSVVANSFKSHQLLQFAKTLGKGNEIKEALFKAHFSGAKNIDDINSLLEIAESAGMEGKKVKEVLSSGEYAYNVKQDEQEARNIGVQGVPFFVFNNKYAVSGAQASETFLEVLNKSWEEFSAGNKIINIKEGDSCGPDSCD